MPTIGILGRARASTGAARTRWRTVGAAVLLVALVGLGWLAAVHSPDRDYVTGLWPVGLGTAAVLVAPVRARTPTSLLVGVAGALAALLGGAAPGAAAGLALVVAAEVWVAAALLRRGRQTRPELRSDDDLRRYFAAAGVGALIGAVGAATLHAAAGSQDLDRVALGVGTAHLASQLFVVPLFLRLPVQGAIARGGERVLQWLVMLVATPLLLVPEASPSLAFLVIPILAWSALRITPLESVLQLLAVVVLAIVLTSYGIGPFADVPERYDLPGDFRGVLLSAFCATLAVIVVPLMLRVGEYVGAARAAAAERDLVRGIVESATGVAIVGTDADGLITLFNPGAEQLLGYRADEVLGRRTTIFHSPDSLRDKATELGVAEDFSAVAQAIMQRRLVSTLMRVRRKDGVERVHSTTLTRLTVAGVTTGYLSTSEDVTDQVATEHALREALATEKRAVERLREVDQVKDQFVSTVSHELRTPLTSILGYLEMLADESLGPLGAAQVDAVSRVRSNSDRLLSLIEDLLTLSRVADTGLQPREESFDLREAVRAAYDVVAPTWTERRVLDVGIELPDRFVPTHGDRDMVERLVVNLLGNAVKFTDDGGTVLVALRVDAEAGQSVLVVRDSGVGIPVEEQEHLFTRFFRSSISEVRAIPGSGLGLSIAQAVVERHGGSIGVVSATGEGTTFEVRLPMGSGLAQGMSKIQPPLDPVT